MSASGNSSPPSGFPQPGQPLPLWGKAVLLVVILALIYFKPRIQSWLDEYSATAAVQSESNEVADNASTGTEADSPEETTQLAPEDTPGTELRPEVPATSPTSASEEETPTTAVKEDPQTQTQDTEASPVSKKTSESRKATPAKKSGRETPVERMDRENTQVHNSGNSQRADEGAEKQNGSLGKLREIRNNVFESTAGLQYVPGSEDGHRLRHIMKHTKDDPSKPIHGVFDNADREQVLSLIDEAWLKARKGGSDVRSEKQGGRTVYTVNLRRRIGQVGGSDGERKGHPECRYLRLVLEENVRVITAYPTRSF